MKRNIFPIDKNTPITPNEQIFVNTLAITNDPQKALNESGIKKGNITKPKALKMVNKIINHPIIKQAYQKAITDRLKRIQTTQDAIIAQLYRFATCNPNDINDSNGNIKDIKDMPHDVQCCINSVEVKSIFEGRGANRRLVGHTTNVKLNSQLDALKFLFEKYLFREEAVPVQFNQYNINNTNVEKQQTINVDNLSSDQVRMLLELKGYKETTMDYQKEA